MGKEFSKDPQNMKPKSSRRQPSHNNNFYNTLPSFSGTLRKSETFTLNQAPSKTEYGWQYKGEKQSIKSFIKDKNLLSLKALLKSENKS